MHLTDGIKELEKVFRNNPISQVHQRSHPILHAISEEKENLQFMFRWFLESHYEQFRRFSITGDFIIPIYNSHAFSFDAGIFSPHDTNYSYATMHNHDDVELSTINIFGSGYNSLIFKEGFETLSGDEVKIELDAYKRHSLENIEYIKNNVAHTVFFPKDLTITLTLWSSSRSIRNGISDKWYRFTKKRKSRKRKEDLYKKYGVTGLSYVLQDWFYPAEGKIHKIPYYREAPYGKNFFNNFLFKLQTIGFDDNQLVEQYFDQVTLSQTQESILNQYLRGERLHINHEGDAMITPTRNVLISEYQKCFPDFDFTLTQ